MFARACAVAAAGLLAACAGSHPVRTQFHGFEIDTTVDSPAARERLLNPAPPGPVDRARLRRLSREQSPDYATVVLAEALLRDPVNARVMARFRAHLADVRAGRAGPLARRLAGLHVAFVPGWQYQSLPGTGADFAAQRRLLETWGIAHSLIRIDENGAVEDNADHIHSWLASRPADEAVILVSASKGGPEVALALDRLARESGPPPVRGWINVGGLLNGSPLAELAQIWPLRWFTRQFLVADGCMQGVDSLLPARLRLSADTRRLPREVVVLNYLAVPLSGHIGANAEFGYKRLKSEGPNDGLTLLTDALVLDAPVVVEIGLDHYYADPRIDQKALALAATAADLIAERERAAPLPDGP